MIVPCIGLTFVVLPVLTSGVLLELSSAKMNPAVHCQLWMGSLEPNMTESFIMNAFQKMNEQPQNVKLMRNKFTGEPAGYCFVQFGTDEEAVDAMHKLNGKPIPGTNPIIRFRLNNASRESKANAQTEREFSLWVGDLSSDVDDYSLYRTFSQKYSSIKTAKVILDGSGFSKGYGFVRFGNEEEQKNALWAMNGHLGLGSKALKICNAVPKPKTGATGPAGYSGGQSSSPTGSSALDPDVSASVFSFQEYAQQYYDPSAYWQNYSQAWSGYYSGDRTDVPPHDAQTSDGLDPSRPPDSLEDDYELVEHRIVTDVDQCNREIAEQELRVIDELESSNWIPIEAIESY